MRVICPISPMPATMTGLGHGFVSDSSKRRLSDQLFTCVATFADVTGRRACLLEDRFKIARRVFEIVVRGDDFRRTERRTHAGSRCRQSVRRCGPQSRESCIPLRSSPENCRRIGAPAGCDDRHGQPVPAGMIGLLRIFQIVEPDFNADPHRRRPEKTRRRWIQE